MAGLGRGQRLAAVLPLKARRPTAAQRRDAIVRKYAAWLLDQHTDWTPGEAHAYAAAGPRGLQQYRIAAARRKAAVTLDEQVREMQRRHQAVGQNRRGIQRIFVDCELVRGCTLSRGHSGPCQQPRARLISLADLDEMDPPNYVYDEDR